MSTARPFAYNPSQSPISGTTQTGDLAVGVSSNNHYNGGIGGVRWWNGPDEDLGYIIAYPVPSLNQPNPLGDPAGVGFSRTSSLTDSSFVKLVNAMRKGQTPYITATQAKAWVDSQGYWTSYGQIPEGMVLFLDAGDTNSYPGTGSTWFDLSGLGNNGTISGATFSSTNSGVFDFDGVNDAITFSSPSEIPIGNDPYTISVWFNSDEMPSNRGFVGWGAFGSVNEVNAWRLRDSGVSGFRHYWWGNDLDYTTPMTSGTWYNAIAAYQNGSRKLYLNNVQVAEDFPTGHNVPYATNLRIGVTAEFLGEWFDGKIAQVIIYKRQATEQEINAIWVSGKSRFGY